MRERVHVPCAEIALRIERTDGLGDRVTVQQFKLTAACQGLISRTPHTPDCHRDYPHAGRGPCDCPRRRAPAAVMLRRDLALEFRIDPDPNDAPARRLDPRVRLTRGAIHRDIVSHIRRLDRSAKHPLAGPPLGPCAVWRSIHPRCSASPIPRRPANGWPSNWCVIRSDSATTRNAATSRTTPSTRSEKSRRGCLASDSRRWPWRSGSRSRPASRSGAGRDGSISRSIVMGHRPRRADKMVTSYHVAATPSNPPSVAINRCNISLDLMLQPMLQQKPTFLPMVVEVFARDVATPVAIRKALSAPPPNRRFVAPAGGPM